MRSRHDGTGRARGPLSFLCGTHRTGQDTRPLAERGPAAEPEVVVVGAHGGAGTTTIAMLLRPAWDMGTALIADTD
jgi:hypothetical protein